MPKPRVQQETTQIPPADQESAQITALSLIVQAVLAIMCSSKFMPLVKGAIESTINGGAQN